MHKRDKTYILAVSGGVDSVVLLDILASRNDASLTATDTSERLHGVKRPSKLDFEGKVEELSPPYQLIIAHFDHGMRSDSARDAAFVKELAQKYNLEFVSERVELGEKASEKTARIARYKFLQTVADRYKAQIITAHHQDDLIETAIINLLRGTYRKGLTALKSGEIIRPLLSLTKSEIYSYARKHSLVWREDSTNASDKYLRNYVRHNIVPRLSAVHHRQFLTIIWSQARLNHSVDSLLEQILPLASSYEISRSVFVMQDKIVARQIIAWLLTSLDEELELTKALIENIFWFVRSAKSNKQFKLKHIDVEIHKGAQVVFKKSKSC